MKMLKSRGSRIDPFGNPDTVLFHSLNESLLLQLWFLFVRPLLMNEVAFTLRLQALSFATIRL